MLRRLKSTSRKDISSCVKLLPETDNGKFAVTMSFVMAERLQEFKGSQIFLRCTDRYGSQTVEGGAVEAFEGNQRFIFDEMLGEHDPEVQLRLVDPGTKRIVADTVKHGLPGLGSGPGAKRSLIIVIQGPELVNELFKVEWKEVSPRPVLYLNSRQHSGIKSILLNDPSYSGLIKPAILRSVLTFILTEDLHVDESGDRYECARKWLDLCKRRRWNPNPVPEHASSVEVKLWIDAAVESYAEQLGMPGKWRPVTP
jgi:hypothetical protein